MMTDVEKVAVMVRWVTEADLELYGCYPYDYVWCGERLFVAGRDEGKDRERTEIVEYTRHQLLDWLDRAVAVMRLGAEPGDPYETPPLDLVAFLRGIGWPGEEDSPPFGDDWHVLMKAFSETFEPIREGVTT
jgi:hypothetical protein